ncbi:hypothetical protein F52700_5995 [Fusarium sp. NRRL 52700]|nr:hypothetical protein F52700_5995 [Fusarium sp. NRRL 52700]
MSCFVPSTTASKAERSSRMHPFQARSSGVVSTCKSCVPKPYRPKATPIIPENWYDEVDDSEEYLIERPSLAIKALRARQYFRKIAAVSSDKCAFGEPLVWDANKLQASLLFTLDALYGERNGEKEYPAEWEDDTAFTLFLEKTVSTWVDDLPDEQKVFIDGLSYILESELMLDDDDEADWNEFVSRAIKYFGSVDLSLRTTRNSNNWIW